MIVDTAKRYFTLAREYNRQLPEQRSRWARGILLIELGRETHPAVRSVYLRLLGAAYSSATEGK